MDRMSIDTDRFAWACDQLAQLPKTTHTRAAHTARVLIQALPKLPDVIAPFAAPKENTQGVKLGYKDGEAYATLLISDKWISVRIEDPSGWVSGETSQDEIIEYLRKCWRPEIFGYTPHGQVDVPRGDLPHSPVGATCAPVTSYPYYGMTGSSGVPIHDPARWARTGDIRKRRQLLEQLAQKIRDYAITDKMFDRRLAELEEGAAKSLDAVNEYISHRTNETPERRSRR
jgi:hypothetical protein